MWVREAEWRIRVVRGVLGGRDCRRVAGRDGGRGLLERERVVIWVLDLERNLLRAVRLAGVGGRLRERAVVSGGRESNRRGNGVLREAVSPVDGAVGEGVEVRMIAGRKGGG